MLLPNACSRASEQLFLSIYLEGLSLLTVFAEVSDLSAMPPVSEQWNQLSNEELRSEDRNTFHLHSYDSASVSRTPTISGPISTQQYVILSKATDRRRPLAAEAVPRATSRLCRA